uniref:Putative secreted protein n=1 Tax=Xenopsylla cheopis TaxID=163159 RepID=A0A6M2DZP1_XENCH
MPPRRNNVPRATSLVIFFFLCFLQCFKLLALPNFDILLSPYKAVRPVQTIHLQLLCPSVLPIVPPKSTYYFCSPLVYCIGPASTQMTPKTFLYRIIPLHSSSKVAPLRDKN